MNRLSEFLHDRRARKLGLTYLQIIGADCARCGNPFGIDGRYPSLYSPARGVRVHACQGGCGPKADARVAEGPEISARIHDANWARVPVDVKAEPDEWQGHFFPYPEEMGIDPESFPGGPDGRGNCTCEMTYAEYLRTGEECAL